MWCVFFFFSSRRRHTRYWRDWSSDVCSSDLDRAQAAGGRDARRGDDHRVGQDRHAHAERDDGAAGLRRRGPPNRYRARVGRASGGGKGVISGGAGIFKKKKYKHTVYMLLLLS